jgi:hypothetical protein
MVMGCEANINNVIRDTCRDKNWFPQGGAE